MNSISERVFHEAILNAYTHRSYDSPASIYVKHYADKLVIENPGGFMADITPENIITYPSLPRNKLIAETLQRLRYVQRSGKALISCIEKWSRWGNHIPSILYMMLFV